jgi:hypothetical protein
MVGDLLVFTRGDLGRILGARFIVKFRPSAVGLGCVIPFVETVQINMPEQAREEMIKYCAAHPKSPTATRRPQLLLRNGLWIALLGPSVEDGILGIGSTVEGALRAFDARYALERVHWPSHRAMSAPTKV